MINCIVILREKVSLLTRDRYRIDNRLWTFSSTFLFLILLLFIYIREKTNQCLSFRPNNHLNNCVCVWIYYMDVYLNSWLNTFTWNNFVILEDFHFNYYHHSRYKYTIGLGIEKDWFNSDSTLNNNYHRHILYSCLLELFKSIQINCISNIKWVSFLLLLQRALHFWFNFFFTNYLIVGKNIMKSHVEF